MKKVSQEQLDQVMDVSDEIDSLSRAPFRRALADALEGRPDAEDFREFARKSPDSWSQSVAILAKASGYQDKQVVEHNYFVKLARMSDSEVEARLEQVKAELSGEVIEGEVVEEADGVSSQSKSGD